ncbi:MAG: transposase [Opitutaceae bacterium]|nr:transposase [Opitutaceae bacterium]
MAPPPALSGTAQGAAAGLAPRSALGIQVRVLFPDLFSRKVVANFSGGTLSTDGGLLLLRQIDAGLGLGLTRTLAGCSCDQRDQRFVDYSMPQLLAHPLRPPR